VLVVVTILLLVLSTASPAPPTAAADWPLFGGTSDNTRFAPLAQINTATVKRLRVAWRRDEGFGQFTWETFPVVVGRRMYLTTNTDAVWALDAATGAVIWTYAPRVNFFVSGVGAKNGAGVGLAPPTNRGVAVSAGKVYELTFDCHLLALDAATGKLLWQVPVADPRLGYYETTAPTVWQGLVFVGSSGGDNGARGFVAAYSAATGTRVWQRWTVPAPGHGWVPKRGDHGGGAVWMPPTIDTATGILYVGTGNPSPNFVGSVRPGANPYADGIMALRARSGTMLWFTPLLAHDVWDYDAASPVVVFDVHQHGRTIHAVGAAGKSGYYLILDARTGKRLFAALPFVTERHRPPTRAGTLECPGDLGGSEYSPVAYSPATHAAYVSGINDCMIVKTAAPAQVAAHKPGQPDLGGMLLPGPERPSGTFTAVDVNSGRPLWQRRMPAPMIGGAAATAGNLVFAGSSDGVLYAFDALNGHICWQRNLRAAFGSAPIVYMIDRREYLAIVSGGAVETMLNHLGPIGGTLYVLTLDSSR
jgi:PQQ-dependent dehydrogenase (methanol/ethanol family)